MVDLNYILINLLTYSLDQSTNIFGTYYVPDTAWGVSVSEVTAVIDI